MEAAARARAEVVATLQRGVVPLHYASGGGHLVVLELLLSAGANLAAKDKVPPPPLALSLFH